MKQNQKHSILNRYSISTLALAVILIAAFGLVGMERNRTDAAPSVKNAASTVNSQFSFTGASGWWRGATNETSMALFSNDHSCFTSVQHKTGTVDDAVELKKIQTSLAGSGYTSTLVASQMTTVQTNSGSQQYKLYQYNVATPTGGTQVEGGQEYGYLQLSTGYLEVQGNCNTASELSTTLPALQAVKFDAKN
jgi:hypothetical protein